MTQPNTTKDGRPMTEAPRFKYSSAMRTTRPHGQPATHTLDIPSTFAMRCDGERGKSVDRVQPHTRRAERKIIESTNQTTKVAPSGKNSLHVRGVYQAEQQ